MAVTRSVATRLMEGLKRDFAADADVADFFITNGGGIRIGPITDDPQIIRPPQINIALLPNSVFETGTSGVARDTISILIKTYFLPESIELPTGVGSVNPYDWVEHLIKIILRGSENAEYCRGYIKDPDHVGASNDPLRWLNIAMPTFADLGSQLVPGLNFVLIPTAVNFLTRLDNVTLARVN